LGQRGQRVIGVISDTHGLMRPEAVEALRGVEMILHAGDIGKPEVLEELGRIAPVLAVRGNNDRDEWAEAIPETRVEEIGGVSVYMLHDLKTLDIDPAADGHRVVITGHSHKPLVKEENGVLYLNPGSAGPRRFKLSISVGLLKITSGVLSAELIELDVTTKL
jgi:putative phosphoesterase